MKIMPQPVCWGVLSASMAVTGVAGMGAWITFFCLIGRPR